MAVRAADVHTSDAMSTHLKNLPVAAVQRASQRRRMHSCKRGAPELSTLAWFYSAVFPQRGQWPARAPSIAHHHLIRRHIKNPFPSLGSPQCEKKIFPDFSNSQTPRSHTNHRTANVVRHTPLVSAPATRPLLRPARASITCVRKQTIADLQPARALERHHAPQRLESRPPPVEAPTAAARYEFREDVRVHGGRARGAGAGGDRRHRDRSHGGIGRGGAGGGREEQEEQEYYSLHDSPFSAELAPEPLAPTPSTTRSSPVATPGQMKGDDYFRVVVASSSSLSAVDADAAGFADALDEAMHDLLEGFRVKRGPTGAGAVNDW
ncbi:hypothetical protein BZA05DRAFT_58341 [Tricharina praecox]|uniref:uncharacterized protein n=1 Tax=Tricharina praecox TaxID=43433 RepID=UPI00221EB28C|nr:uncharacterized protein BZA05DRAFT_58341 [Tricharina praecox]KAI5850596.1 hypothetical protein BZA05DRAFT_58341 [Tricharina praecox]